MNSIRDFVQNEPFFETHDHLSGYSKHDWSNITYRELMGYAPADMEVALNGGNYDELSDEEFFHTWQFVRTTGYGQAVELGARALLDSDYTFDNIKLINQKLQDFVGKRSNKEIYTDLLKQANIVGSVNDVLPAHDISTTLRMDHKDFPELCRFAVRLEGLHAVKDAVTIHELEEHLNCSVTTLSELEASIEQLIDRAVALGHVKALKIGLAYQRSLDFDLPTVADAEEAFSALMSGKDLPLKPLHDHLLHHFIRCAQERNLVVQIHTGYLAGCWTDIRQGNPSPLIPVFAKYPEVKFDLFHAGWPWSELLGAIGKHFPNVWLDLCWAWTMNPVQMERILDEWLSAVPSNKILGYGSDTGTPFCTVGYAQQARNGISTFLENKISRGEYNKQTAQFIAQRIMHKNARDLFS